MSNHTPDIGDIPRIDPLEIEKMLGIGPGLPNERDRYAVRFFLDDMRRRWPNLFAECFVRSLVQFEQVADLIIKPVHVPGGDFEAAPTDAEITAVQPG